MSKRFSSMSKASLSIIPVKSVCSKEACMRRIALYGSMNAPKADTRERSQNFRHAKCTPSIFEGECNCPADETNHRIAHGAVSNDTIEMAAQLNVQVTATHAVQGLVVKHHCGVRVLERRVHAQDRTVRRATGQRNTGAAAHIAEVNVALHDDLVGGVVNFPLASMTLKLHWNSTSRQRNH